MPLGVFLVRQSGATSLLEEAFLHNTKLSQESIVSFFSDYNFRVGRGETAEIDGERVVFGATGVGENVLLLGVIVENDVEEKLFKESIVDEAATIIQSAEGKTSTLLLRSYSNMLERALSSVEKRIIELEDELAKVDERRRRDEKLLEAKYDEETSIAERAKEEEAALDKLQDLFREEEEIEKRVAEGIREKERISDELGILRGNLNRISSVLAQVRAVLAQEKVEEAVVEEATPEEKFYTVFDVLKKEYGEEDAVLLEYLYLIKTPQTLDDIVFHVKWGAEIIKTKLNELVKKGYVCTLRKKNTESLFFTVCPSCPLSSKCKKERKIDWDRIISFVETG